MILLKIRVNLLLKPPAQVPNDQHEEKLSFRLWLSEQLPSDLFDSHLQIIYLKNIESCELVQTRLFSLIYFAFLTSFLKYSYVVLEKKIPLEFVFLFLNLFQYLLPCFVFFVNFLQNGRLEEHHGIFAFSFISYHLENGLSAEVVKAVQEGRFETCAKLVFNITLTLYAQLFNHFLLISVT